MKHEEAINSGLYQENVGFVSPLFQKKLVIVMIEIFEPPLG